MYWCLSRNDNNAKSRSIKSASCTNQQRGRITPHHMLCLQLAYVFYRLLTRSWGFGFLTTERLQIFERRCSVLRMLVFIWCLAFCYGVTRVQEGVWGHRPVLEGGRKGGGGSGHSYSQPKILRLSHILSPWQQAASEGTLSCCRQNRLVAPPCLLFFPRLVC